MKMGFLSCIALFPIMAALAQSQPNPKASGPVVRPLHEVSREEMDEIASGKPRKKPATNSIDGPFHSLEQAASTYERLAKDGNPEAQYRLGRLKFGKELQPIPQKLPASKLFRQAADQGHPGAQVELGLIYIWNERDEYYDPAEARVLFEKAARQGYDEGQLQLGRLLLGPKIEKNLPEALNWIRKSAEAGNKYGQYMLGNLLMDNASSDEDLYSVKKDWAEVVKWLTLSTEENPSKETVLDAQTKLGRIYQGGCLKGQQDQSRAEEWFEKSAVRGHGVAQHYLGVRRRDGIFGPQDKVKAYMWFSLSGSRKELKELEMDLSEDDRRKAKRLAREFTVQ
jgi:uncharacterized protein